MNADGRLTYLITFDRIGRDHNITPLELTVDDGPVNPVLEQLAEGVYRYAKRKVISSELAVDIAIEPGQEPRPSAAADIDGATGMLIVGGFRPAGTFTVKAVAA